MVRTPKKQNRTPRTQNRESPTNITKDQRSEFGKILYNDFLRGEGRRLTQKALAQAMGVSQAIISEFMYHVAAIGYDQDAYERLYDIFKGLNDLDVPIDEDLAWKLLNTVKDHRGKDTYLSDQQKKELISKLQSDLVIKRTYWTKWKTPLLGRDQDIEKILHILHEEETRFLTLVGLPGVGKTELALQIEDLAQRQDQFTNVQFFYFETFTEVNNALQVINAYLQKIDTSKRTLLIFDGCEQIINLRKGLYEETLRKHRQLTILATSQIEFSKQMIEIEPLQNTMAIQLFYDIAHRRDSSFRLTNENATTIANICQYLDGLPIGISIAASWVKELGVPGVYKWLYQEKFLKYEVTTEDSERQKSLYNLLEASYQLLNENEQGFFRRLGIFGNLGCSKKIAQAVCNLNNLLTNEDEFTNVLKVLSDHHLITFINKRVKIAHKILSIYAEQKMLESNDEVQPLMIRFVDYFYYLKNMNIGNFESLGYNHKDTYKKSLQLEIIYDDIGENSNKVNQFLGFLQFQYLRQNAEKLIGKIIEKEEYQMVEKLLNYQYYDHISFEEVEQIVDCYRKILRKVIEEDHNYPYPKDILNHIMQVGVTDDILGYHSIGIDVVGGSSSWYSTNLLFRALVPKDFRKSLEHVFDD